MASLKKKKPPRQPFRPGGAVFDDAPLRRAAGRHDTGQWRGLVPTAEGNQGTGETHAVFRASKNGWISAYEC